ncbi:hypothetical protein D3C72_2261940 [compost metagenome]
MFDSPMNPFTLQAKAQKCRLAEQAFQVEVRVLADQFNLDRIQATDGFTTVKRQHLEIIANRGDQ